MHSMYRQPMGPDLCQGDIVEKLIARPREQEFITLAVVRMITNIFDKSEAQKGRTVDRLKNIIQHKANTRFVRARRDRPCTARDIRDLIRKMSLANPGWGAPRPWRIAR
jgi:hypothetical protein